jgi:hypothetical protein
VWWDRSETADIFLSDQHAAMWWAGQHECVLASPEAGPVGALARILAGRTAPMSCRVWLGGSLCRLRLDPGIQGVHSVEEAERALDGASLALGDSTGLSHRLLSWTPTAEVWPSVGVGQGLVDAIELAVVGAGHRVKTLKPWWSGVAPAQRVDALMIDDRSATFWRWSDGRLAHAATVGLTPDAERRRASIRRLHAAGALACWRMDPARSGSAGSWLGSERCEGTDGESA